MTLEERITRLEDIEAIKQLQSKYQRCLDTRDFDGIKECFADDVVSSYDNGNLAFNGKEAVVGYLKQAMVKEMPTAHFIHGSEVEVDGDTANAKWYLEDYVFVVMYKLTIHGAAIYDNTYEKVDGRWFIKTIGYTRTFESKLPEPNLVIEKTTYLDKLK